MNLSLIRKFSDVVWDFYSKDSGRMLVHMGALGWIFSSAAQFSAILTDKNIDKDKRKFLLPQEGADAAVNVGLYYTICSSIKNCSDNLIDKGNLASGDFVKKILSLSDKGLVKNKDWKSVFSKKELENLSKAFENIEKLDVLKNLNPSNKAHVKETLKQATGEFHTFKNGMGCVAAVFASILACNVITPVVRNFVASKIQKRMQEKEVSDLSTVSTLGTPKKTTVSTVSFYGPMPKEYKGFKAFKSYTPLGGTFRV